MSMTVPDNAPRAPVPQAPNPLYQPRNYFNDYNGGNSRSLPGYFIKDETEIVPKYIPMDGSISFFPYQNLSKIIIKQWDANGLQTLTYTVVPPAGSQSQSNDQQQSKDDGKLPIAAPVQQQPDPIMSTLEQINTGLSTTFTQIGTTLQAIQQEVNQFNTMLTNAINEGFGGRG